MTATIPDQTTIKDFVISDVIQAPTRQLYVAGSAACNSTIAGYCAGSSVSYSGGTNTVSLSNASTHTNTSGGPQTITLSFSVTVADIGANSAGATLLNRGTVAYTDQYNQLRAPQTNQTTVTIVEPNPQITKTDNESDNVVSPGQTIEYTLTITNPDRTSPARPASPLHDGLVVDTVPTGLTPVDLNGDPIPDGGTVTRCDGSSGGSLSGIWDQTAHTITWTVNLLAPAATIEQRYCVEVDDSPSPAAGSELTNTAEVTGTSMPTVGPEERTYSSSANDTMTITGSTLTKSANPTTAPVGKQIQFTVTSTLPANTTFYLYEVNDTLPAGMSFISFDGFACAGNCGAVPTPTTSDSGQDLNWDFDDIPADTAARTITLTYSAVVDDVVGNQTGTTLTNDASNTWCTIDTEVCPPSNIVTPPHEDATVTVTEPNLTIDKDVGCQTGDADTCEIQPGDSFSYSITVTNNGDTTAYDAIIQDQVPSNLTNVVVGSLPGGVSNTTPDVPNTHAWTIDSLAPTASVTITYTADLVASSSLSDPFTVANTARVTQYWGLDDAERASNPDAREYPEGADPTDTVTLNGNLPEPEVVKTVANSGNAELNQPIQWTLTIGNNSAYADLNDIDVVDTMPAGWEYQAGSAQLDATPLADPSIGGTVPSGQVLTWTDIGDIAAGGADKVLTFNAIPRASALDMSGNPTNPYTNLAAITGDDASGADESQDGPYADSDSENANIQMPNLTIVKTPNNATVHAGDWSDWTIVVTNTGTGTARDVEIREAVPGGLFFNVVTHPETIVCASPATCDNPSGPYNVIDLPVNSGSGPNSIHWKLDSLAPGQSVTLTIPMYVDQGTASGTIYTNDAYANSTERPTEVTDGGQWTTDQSTDLSITKVGTPSPGTAGQNITYTLTATNNGPSTASGVSISDTINTAQFEFVSITPTDNVNDSCTTTGSPVVTAVDCSVGGTLTAGNSATFTLVLKVKSGLTGNVSNTATVTGNEPDPDTDNNSDTETIPLGTVASLTIDKVVSSGEPSTIYNHDQTEFTMTVTNNGPSDALSVVVSDDLPAGLSCVSTTPASSGCAGTAGEVVTYNLGTITAGDSVTLTMVVRGEAVGTNWQNVATVTSPTDPTDSNDDATVTVDPMADLQIYKDMPEGVASGEDFDVELTIENLGPDSAVTPTVTDNLPAGLIYTGYTVTQGSATCTITGQAFSCDLPTMASGDEIVIEIHVNSGFSFSEGQIDNSASVSSETHDSDPENNEDSDSTGVGPNADVAITKAGPAFGADGWPLSYTLSVVNNGPAESWQVVVTDTLPAGVTFQSASSTVGNCTESSGTVTCELGDMEQGATAQITIVVVPGPSNVGTTIHNVATVSSETPDGVPANNQDDEDTPIENNAYPTSSNVSLTKTSSNATPKVGDLISFTLVATNHGPDTARSAVITDTLPGGLIYSSASGEGTCSYASPVVTCQLGDIPNGQSRTIVINAYVARTGSIENSAVANAANDRIAGDNTAVSPITAAKSTAKISVSKKASKQTVRVGKKVSYTIKVKNVSKVNAVNVEVCDLIPSRLTVVRKDGGTLRSGNLCWTIPVLRAGKSQTFKPTFRVTNGRGASVTNPVRARAYNARTARAKAKVRVPARASRAGGTTG